MPKRLAITIAGAVSLGSYEAGVLFELIRAFEEHNRQAAESEAIKIDVLTGASAGSTVAAIVAQKLLYDADALRGDLTNALYLPWVQDLDIVPLLAMGGDEQPDHSILSSNFTSLLSRRYLMARYQTQVPPTANLHPVSAQKIRLGLALSNLNGVDYYLNTRPVGKFVYTRYQDDLRMDLSGPESDRGDRWDIIRAAAVASGSFPFAFRVQDLVRHMDEYPAPTRMPFASGPTATFAYTDGGVFQNEPLGLAKNLVDGLDRHFEEDPRFYIFVSPGARGSTSNSTISSANAEFRNLAGHLMTAVFEQSQFRDWIMAEDVNARVAVFDGLAANLHALCMSGTVTAAALVPLTGAVLAQMFPAANQEMEGALRATQMRLAKQFSAEFTALRSTQDAQVASAWIDVLVILEAAAHVEEKDTMLIYGATASPNELAGAQLHAFQGFIDRAYRQHDFDVGRQKARDLIQAVNVNNDPLGPIQYADAAASVPIEHKLDGLRMADIPIDNRRKLRSRLHNRLTDAMKKEKLNALERQGIDWLVLNHFLDAVLEL